MTTSVLMLGADRIGSIGAPDGWQVSSGVWMREPESECERAPLAMKSASRRPRALISVRCERSEEVAEQAMSRWLGDFSKQVACRTIEVGKTSFEDGAEGCFAILSFDVGRDGRAAQCHVFRAGGGVVTQLTASVAEHQQGR